MTSFDPDECAKRCAAGVAAKAEGEPVVARVAECAHFVAALDAQCGSQREQNTDTPQR